MSAQQSQDAAAPPDSMIDGERGRSYWQGKSQLKTPCCLLNPPPLYVISSVISPKDTWAYIYTCWDLRHG